MGFHVREVDPAVRGRVAHDVDFAGAFAVLQIHEQHVVGRVRGGVAHRQRQLLHTPVEGLPHVVKRDATGEQLFSVLGHHIAHALRAAFYGVIAMNEHHRRSLHGGLLLQIRWQPLADRVVKHHHAFRAGVSFDVVNDLRIEGGLHRCVFVKFGEFGGKRMQLKALAIQRELIDLRPAVVDGRLPLIGARWV